MDVQTRHFVYDGDFSADEVRSLYLKAGLIKADPRAFADRLAGKTLGMIFEKSSTRTRVSFEVGMLQMGGAAIFLSSRDIQLGRGESVIDTARVLSRYVDGLMLRTYAQERVDELASAAAVPVINGLSDRYHPCQALADLFTLEERTGSLIDRKLAYVGDGNNVCHSLLLACAHLGVAISTAHPEGYEPAEDVVAEAREVATAPVEIGEDPAVACRDADAVYTDVWTSMGEEDEAEARRRIFEPYRVDMKLLDAAKPGAIFLHCLPAHRGEEVTDQVLDHPRSAVLDQAENRLHVQKALLETLLGEG